MAALGTSQNDESQIGYRSNALSRHIVYIQDLQSVMVYLGIGISIYGSIGMNKNTFLVNLHLLTVQMVLCLPSTRSFSDMIVMVRTTTFFIFNSSSTTNIYESIQANNIFVVIITTNSKQHSVRIKFFGILIDQFVSLLLSL